jgi:hypothetical protein
MLAASFLALRVGPLVSLPVRLMPNTVYAVSINSFENTGFKDRNGAPALPYGWTFRTR